MGKAFRIILLATAALLSFESFCLSAQVETGPPPASSANEPLPTLLASTPINEAAFFLPQMFAGLKPFDASGFTTPFRVKENLGDWEIEQVRRSSPKNDTQENNPIYSERDYLRKNISGYRFHQIPFSETFLDSFSKIISGLAVGQYKEPDALFRGLEASKEIDIVKSLSILLQLELHF